MKSDKNIREGYKRTAVGMIPEEWEVKKLKDVVDFLNNQRIPIKASDRQQIQGNIPYYGASGIIDYVNDYIFDDELLLLGEDGANILTRSRRSVFKISGKSWVNNHAHVLKLKKGYDIDFYNDYLESLSYIKYNTSQAQPKLNKEECEKIPVVAPPLPEQQAIANCLTTWDSGIEKLTQLIAAKREQKKGLMQQLLTGKKRLDGFVGEWKEIKLGDVAKVKSSKRVLQKDWIDNGVPFYRTREIISLAKNIEFRTPIFISEKLFLELSNKYGVPKTGDLLVTGVGTIGETYVVKENDRFYFKDGNVLWIQISNKIDSHFLHYSFKTRYIRKQLMDNASITTVATYTIEGARDTNILLPSIKEQIAIVEVLTTADQEISLLEAKLAAMKEEKKGLMQVLLTGEKRLIDS